MVSAMGEKVTTMRVLTDEKRCYGAGQCVLAAPRVFDQGENGIVRLLDDQPPKEFHAAVHEAVGLCPNHAISLSK